MRFGIPALAAATAMGLALISIVGVQDLTARDSQQSVRADGIVKQRSAYALDETVARIKADISSKGIVFFQVIDQAKLAGDSGISIRPSRLLIFGNPALGTHFISARSEAGLDWPVRLLVFQDNDGQVWTAYTDFSWIARRHGITNRQAEFAKATEVIGSITSSVTVK